MRKVRKEGTPDELGSSFLVSRLQSVAMLVGGVSLIIMGLFAALIVVLLDISSPSAHTAVLLTISWVVAGHAGAFHISISREDWAVFGTVVTAVLQAAIVTTIPVAILARSEFSAFGLLTTAALAIALLFAGIHTGRGVVRALWSSGKFRTTAIVVGGSRLTEELVVELSHSRELGIDVISHIDLRDGRNGVPTPRDLLELVEATRPDRLVIGDIAFDEAEMVHTLRRTGEIGTRVYIVPRLFEMGVGNSLFSADQLRGFPLHRINRPAHPRASLALKRALDIAVSGLALLATLPLLAFFSVLIKLTSPGPILFWQERVGQHNRIIRVPKLRSMTTSDTSDTEWTAESRISPVGKILRSSAIDELPQLWSVIVGDMSLVGPRPERPAFVAEFADKYVGYDDRHRMKVGLTGLSQIAGLRGDTSIAERAKYDNRYIDQWTLSGDLVIAMRTILAIVRQRVYADRQTALANALNEELVIDDTNRVDSPRTASA